jgi:hypothetical protein
VAPALLMPSLPLPPLRLPAVTAGVCCPCDMAIVAQDALRHPRWLGGHRRRGRASIYPSPISNKVGANLRSLVASNKEHWLPDLVFIFESKRNQSSRIHDQLVGTQDQGGI